MHILQKYFPNITSYQAEQFAALYPLYTEWNSKINVISRKDIENLYERHVLHSLAISHILAFKDGSTVMDVGCGGGFPGIPLAILFPQVHFHLLDSIGKKIKVCTEVSAAIGLTNVSFKHARVEDEKEKFDFIVSRAVMPLSELVRLTTKNSAKKQNNALPNGLICLKGGELEHEILPFKHKASVYDLKNWFSEEFFLTKKGVYMPLL
jgi:16S rRNA (guanine527-N7)-methyltransferase